MDSEDFRTVVECAELAPSVHNTQPWTFSVSGETIEIRADRQRGLAVLDPHGRELTISCGAAIEFACIAVRGLGWQYTLDLLPQPSDADLLATVKIGERRAASSEELALMEAIPRRYTDREDYQPKLIGADLVGTLDRGVSARGSWLRVLDHEGDRLAVISALSHAEEIEAEDPSYREELKDWLRIGSSPDGIPLKALGNPSANRAVSDVPLRDFTGANRHPRPGGDDPPPAVARDTLLMIGTDQDNALSWLQAGRALGWLLLTLTVAGLSSQPLGQVLDIESARVRLAQQIGLLGHVQFLLRAGEGHGNASTGRRHTAVS
jgi:hypothetical protein